MKKSSEVRKIFYSIVGMNAISITSMLIGVDFTESEYLIFTSLWFIFFRVMFEINEK